MGKSKPTQVIVHRIELQETERATLEAALAGRFVTNAATAAGSVFTGIGNLLKPFEGVLTAIGALWIADKGIDVVQDAWEGSIDAGQAWIADRYGGNDYEEICAWLTAQYGINGWDTIFTSPPRVPLDGNGAQVQSSLWRHDWYLSFGVYYHFDSNGVWRALPERRAPLGYAADGGPFPQWLVDQFDAFIASLNRAAVSPEMLATKTPAEWWAQWLTYSDYQQYVVSSVHAQS